MKKMLCVLAIALTSGGAHSQTFGSGHAFDGAIQKLHEIAGVAGTACPVCTTVVTDIKTSFSQRCGRSLDTGDYIAVAHSAPAYSAALGILSLAKVRSAAELPAPLASKYWTAVGMVSCASPISFP